jgi:hypothetical protein
MSHARSKVMFARAQLLLIAVCCLLSEPMAAADLPALFFYPPEFRYGPGHILNSPQTVTAEQATTAFPAIPGMSGIVLMVYWSTLCPDSDRCDFSLIDTVLKFWAGRGKQVVLDVATIGYPYRSIPDGRDTLGATPQWVMQQIETYEYPQTRILGELPYGVTRSAAMPDFRDPRFITLQSRLIEQLARRYDGHPAVAQIRIATGLMGEENPLVGPLVHPLTPHYH